jgi:hypothetical protein
MASSTAADADGSSARRALSLHNAVSLGPAYNSIIDRVSCDIDWLLSTLKPSAEHDPFTASMLRIVHRVYREHSPSRSISEEPRLCLLRQDYLWQRPDNESSTTSSLFASLKQVEINTIAVAFAGMSQELSQLQEEVDAVFKERGRGGAVSIAAGKTPLFPPGRNRAAESYAHGLALAHHAYVDRCTIIADPAEVCFYGGLTPEVCFFCFANDHLDLDQRRLQQSLSERHIPAFTACFDGSTKIEMSQDGNEVLLVGGRHVSVAYFHTGTVRCLPLSRRPSCQ